MAIVLTVAVGCGTAPSTQDCGINGDCPDEMFEPPPSIDESAGLPISDAGEHATAQAPPPVPAAGIPAEPSPPDLSRLLLPTFGESIFDFILPGTFTDGGSLLFGDDQQSGSSDSQLPYLERLCRELDQPDFVCRQRYGD